MSKFKKVRKPLFEGNGTDSIFQTIEGLFVDTACLLKTTVYQATLNLQLSTIKNCDSTVVHGRDQGLRMNYVKNNSRLA